MDLRLGKQQIIRLTKAEYDRFQQQGVIAQSYSLAPGIHWVIEIRLDPGIAVSLQKNEGERILFWLSVEDAAQLSAQEDKNKKNGLKIGEFELQVDIWNR